MKKLLKNTQKQIDAVTNQNERLKRKIQFRRSKNGIKDIKLICEKREGVIKLFDN